MRVMSWWVFLVACSDGGDGNPESTTETGLPTTETGAPTSEPPATGVNLPPSADAGADQLVDEQTSVTLTGTAEDPEGSLVSTTWIQTAGTAVTLSGADTLAPTFDAPIAVVTEVLSFSLVAEDAEGAVGVARTSVTVVPVNAPPVADAGADQAVETGAAVVLSGVGTDADGAVALTEWTQLSGEAVTLSDPLNLSPSFTSPSVASTVVLELRVTDDEGASDTDVVEIAVSAPSNLPPVADAGLDQAVVEGDSVTLSGAASDADGSVVLTEWTQTAGALVALSDPFALAPTFDAPAGPDWLAFQLSVTDDRGAVATDWVEVQVDAPPAFPPTADAGADQVVDEQTLVTLTGSATDDGTVVSTEWVQLAGSPVVFADPFASQTTFTAPVATVAEGLLFEWWVTDDVGLVSTDLVLVTVLPVNAPPTAEAGSDQVVTEFEVVTLQGAASDLDGLVVSTTWTQLLGPTVALSDPLVPMPTFDAPDVVTTETLLFQLDVVDDEGAMASDQVTVDVQPDLAVNNPPVVDAGVDSAVTNGSVAELLGSAFDPDGVVVSTVWTQVTGQPVTLTDPLSPVTDFVAPSVVCPELLVFELTATDDEGAVVTDAVAVKLLGDSAVVESLPWSSDLEASDGALVTDGTEWEWGSPTSGPGAAYSGSSLWGTDLSGNYSSNTDAVLCLPPLDLGGAEATLGLRVWASFADADGLVLEFLNDQGDWSTVGDVAPDYQQETPKTWTSIGKGAQFDLVLAQVPDGAPSPISLRLRVVSDIVVQRDGAYVDELYVGSETEDVDGDGLPGIWDEYVAYGTDPFLADTDGDGVDDAVEVTDGTNPRNPADFVGASTVGPGWSEDFEGDGGGSVGTGDWDVGVLGVYPFVGHQGDRVWATNLTGNYQSNARNTLYLPVMDLSAAGAATLSMRAWVASSDDDGFTLQVFDEVQGAWSSLSVVNRLYDGLNGTGQPGFEEIRDGVRYAPLYVDLTPFAGQSRVQMRWVQETDSLFSGLGMALDAFAVDEEASDPDGDGLLGVLDEALVHGTDPYEADTDGDGVLDGDEVAAGTDPTNPADFAGAVVWVPGAFAGLELDAGGLASVPGSGWTYGVPANGPLSGHTDTRVWGVARTGAIEPVAEDYVYLPLLDLTSAIQPSIGWRMNGSSGATSTIAVVPEVLDPVLGWTPLGGEWPAFNGTDPLGYSAWVDAQTTIGNGYQAMAVSMDGYAGQSIFVRLSVRANLCAVCTGWLLIDDIRLEEESSDPDGDGLPGLVGELSLYGTAGDAADTDEDGVDDPDEITAGTDPLDPASF